MSSLCSKLRQRIQLKPPKRSSAAINTHRHPSQNGCSAWSRAIGEQFIPPRLSPRRTTRPCRHEQGAHVFLKELSSFRFQFAPVLPPEQHTAPHLPSCPLEKREQRLPAPLQNKSRASRVHFRLFYRSHHPAPPCRASLLRADAGPAGHDPWLLSGAALEEQSRAEDWRSSQAGAGTVPVRQPPARTQPLPQQQTKLQRVCAQQLRSCHRCTGSGCGKNNQTTATNRRVMIAINNNRVMHLDGAACGGRADGLAGNTAAQQKPQRGQVHSDTFSLNTFRRSSSARVGLPPPPHMLPLPEPSAWLQPEAAWAGAAMGEAGRSLPAVYK